MPELRWILIVFGFVLLLGIYVWGRRESHAARARQRPEPALEPELRTHEPVIEGEAELASIEAVEPDPAVEPAAETGVEAHIEPQAEEPQSAAAFERSGRYERFARIEPKLGDDDVATADLPVEEPEPVVEAPLADTQSVQTADAPTLGMSSTPRPRTIERRKIIALRLATLPQRIPGAQLLEALEAESLQHGKYSVFHRLADNGEIIFSVASMVEPGTFELDKMAEETYPGVTLFAQLPGPIPGMLAFNELIACGRRLHAALGGTLQDERGVPLTVHRIERMRQEIREFEQRFSGETGLHTNSLGSASP